MFPTAYFPTGYHPVDYFPSAGVGEVPDPVEEVDEGDDSEYLSWAELAVLVDGVLLAADEAACEFTSAGASVTNLLERGFAASASTIRRAVVRATCLYNAESRPAFGEGDVVELIVAVPGGPGVTGQFRVMTFTYPLLKPGSPIKYTFTAESVGRYIKTGMGE